MKNKIITYLPSSRERPWVGMDQIEKEFPAFITKVETVLLSPKYSKVSKDIVWNVCNYLEIWEYISWKQFDMIMKMWPMPAKKDRSYKGKYKKAFDSGWDMPTGKEKMEDFMHFGITFKGLSI